MLYPPDARSFLLRLFQGQDGGPGVLRTLLSDRFGVINNLDLFTAVLDGIRQESTRDLRVGETEVAFAPTPRPW